MLILAWIRRIYKVLSADASPSAIAFGVFFGLILAMIPLWSGLALLLLASLLVLRVQVSSALLAMAVGKLIALCGLAFLFDPVGEVILLSKIGAVRSFWTWALNLPVVAWLDLDRVAVTGGAAVGFILGLALVWPVQKLVIGYRAFLHNRLAGNKFFRWLTSFWLVKGLRWIFLGAEVAS